MTLVFILFCSSNRYFESGQQRNGKNKKQRLEDYLQLINNDIEEEEDILSEMSSIAPPKTAENATKHNLPKPPPKIVAQQLPQSQYYSLRWNNYQSNMTSVFHELLEAQSFVDVTLACEDNSLKAHKVNF